MYALRQTVPGLEGFADYQVVPERPENADAIEALVDLDFGPERFRKTAYRLRDGVAPIAELSFVAMERTRLIGTIRFWPVNIAEQPGLLLGPLAIAPDHQGRGIGQALMHAGLDAAKGQGWGAVILVGDEPYYRRFGFQRTLVENLTLPGPVNADRFLGLELIPGAIGNASGMVSRITP